MGWSPIGNRLTYTEYIMAHEFVEDLKSTTNAASQRLTMDISRQTRDVIASNEALAQENIRATEIAAGQISDAMSSGFGQLSGVMSDGFNRISYDIQAVSAGIDELNATFHWGFGQMISSMGRMNDSLQELIKIAKTPAQTAAYEQYEIARDAFRQGLYQECMESLNIAINGNQASTGYKLDWRFHQMKGSVLLGFVGCEIQMIDLPLAEESFLLAARYAKTDFPDHAGKAFLSAGWAAYCQGKMQEALTHTEQAIAINPNLAEALFQAAKVKMALGEVDAALPVLAKAIDKDRFYALKAAGDEDFQRHDDKLCVFLDAMRNEKFKQAVPKVRSVLETLKFWLNNMPEAKNNHWIHTLQTFIEHGENKALLDILAVVQPLDNSLNELLNNARNTSCIIATSGASVSVSQELSVPVEETYTEDVIVKQGGFFRKAITEKQTRTRTIKKTQVVQRELAGKHVDIYNGVGEHIADFEFCLIPSGSFMMGGIPDHPIHKAKCTIHQVTITRDYYLSKYPITQLQWEAITGNNPSKFKGASLPVENISWEQCQEFIKRINSFGKDTFRLPTEAEWEYACRAGSTTNYFFGDNKAQLDEYAWYLNNSRNQTQPVGQKKPNAWGLHDMYGNVWEHCQDWYESYPSSAVTDPLGTSPGSYSQRVHRGGSWSYGAPGIGSAIRTIGLVSCNIGYDFGSIGFRLVMNK